MEDWNKKIDELTELVSKLIRLSLEIGTLSSVDLVERSEDIANDIEDAKS